MTKAKTTKTKTTRAKFIETCILLSGVGLFWEEGKTFFYFNGDLISASDDLTVWWVNGHCGVDPLALACQIY